MHYVPGQKLNGRRKPYSVSISITWMAFGLTSLGRFFFQQTCFAACPGGFGLDFIHFSVLPNVCNDNVAGIFGVFIRCLHENLWLKFQCVAPVNGRLMQNVQAANRAQYLARQDLFLNCGESINVLYQP